MTGLYATPFADDTEARAAALAGKQTKVEAPAEEVEPAYDPAEYTVPQVKDYVESHPDEADAIADAEEDGEQRSTLLNWLR